MDFQLVRASDTEIAVWETGQGHVFVFEIPPEGEGLRLLHMRAAPDATRPVADFTADALVFATAEARSRQLIPLTPTSGSAAQRQSEAV